MKKYLILLVTSITTLIVLQTAQAKHLKTNTGPKVSYALFTESPLDNGYYTKLGGFTLAANASKSLPINLLYVRIMSPTDNNGEFAKQYAIPNGAVFTNLLSQFKASSNPNLKIYAYLYYDHNDATWGGKFYNGAIAWVFKANAYLKTQNLKTFSGVAFDMEGTGSPATPPTASAMKKDLGSSGLTLEWIRGARGATNAPLLNILDGLYAEIYQTYTNKKICPEGDPSCSKKYTYVDSDGDPASTKAEPYAPDQKDYSPGKDTIFKIASNTSDPATALMSGRTNPAGENMGFLLSNIWFNAKLSDKSMPMFSLENVETDNTCVAALFSNAPSAGLCGTLNAFGYNWKPKDFTKFVQLFAQKYYPNNKTLVVGLFKFGYMPQTWYSTIISGN